MIASALFMAALGLVATFAPHEVLQAFGGDPRSPVVLLVQVAGALYVGFAMLNWMAKALVIGGIYSRPVTVANLSHFTIAALALLKAVVGGQRGTLFVAATVLYVVFAVLFAWVFLRHPTAPADESSAS